MHQNPMNQSLGAMDFHHCFDFAVILQDSIKLLFLKNAKLMALASAVSLVSSSILVSFFDLAWIPFTCDMLARESFFPIATSITAEFITKRQGINQNVAYLLTVFFGFIISYFIFSFFSMMAVIVVSADNKLSLKELSSRILRSWTRPFLTALYTTIFAVGYVYSALYMATPMPIFADLSNVRHAVLFCAVAYVFYLYQSSVWILSLVVAVVEEDGGGGIAALGKSAEIINGHKISGFFINVVTSLICFAVYLCSNLIIEGGKHGMVYGVVLVSFSCFMRILTFVAYTVLYFRAMDLRVSSSLPSS